MPSTTDHVTSTDQSDQSPRTGALVLRSFIDAMDTDTIATHVARRARAGAGAGFTTAFEAQALALCRDVPGAPAGAPQRCTDKQLWRMAFYAGQARTLKRFTGMRIMGNDKARLRREQHYITTTASAS